MSKRVMILLGIGFLCILASFFLHKHEVTVQDPEAEPEEQEPETTNDVQEKEPATDPEPGAGSNKTE